MSYFLSYYSLAVNLNRELQSDLLVRTLVIRSVGQTAIELEI